MTRLESSGHSFILSLERHILRNFIFVHAIENDLPLPIGTQDIGLLDTSANDEDSDLWGSIDGDESDNGEPDYDLGRLLTDNDFRNQASQIYEQYSGRYRRRFRWLPARFFDDTLVKDLLSDAKSLMKVLKSTGAWDAARDAKLNALIKLLKQKHFTDKVLVFSQFSDTADYLYAQLQRAGVDSVAYVTGATDNPTALVQRFSPVSNDKAADINSLDEIRVLLATDVLSEGQNLQDCAIIVNFDLPWAIIRLIQRAGRVDRIGQKSNTILCYSFLPADGVERIINLRGRVRQRLRENAEVVGTDEAFFDDEDHTERPLINLYNEKAGILDGNDDPTEVDLASYAYQIWKNAIDREPELERIIPSLPDVVYSTRPHSPTPIEPEGTLVYLRTAEGHDALAWMGLNGNSVTESQYAILRAAECQPDTLAIDRHENHHDLVSRGVRLIVDTEKSIGGQLGRPSGARFRTYERLKAFADDMKGTLFESGEQGIQLKKVIEDIHRSPLLQSATDILNRQLKSGIGDHDLAELVIGLRADARLCRISDEEEAGEAQVICSMGLRKPV